MGTGKERIWNLLKISALLVILVLSIGFVDRREGDRLISEVKFEIVDQAENYFVDEEEIMAVLQSTIRKPLDGVAVSGMELRKLERALLEHPFIRKAEMYSDLKGAMVVKVSLRRPIARIMMDEGSDRYITNDLRLVEVSQKYTSRVALISGERTGQIVENGLENEYASQIVELVRYINGDEFWKAQIAQIDIQENGQVHLYPQVTKQLVEFGYPEDINTKMEKLKVFYEKILPQMGWNKYSKVSLKYNNQIVCE